MQSSMKYYQVSRSKCKPIIFLVCRLFCVPELLNKMHQLQNVFKTLKIKELETVIVAILQKIPVDFDVASIAFCKCPCTPPFKLTVNEILMRSYQART